MSKFKVGDIVRANTKQLTMKSKNLKGKVIEVFNDDKIAVEYLNTVLFWTKGLQAKDNSNCWLLDETYINEQIIKKALGLTEK